MKFPWSMLLLGFWVSAAGCQPRNEYEQLQRELFQQENKIYGLQRDIQQYRSVLDSCRRANLALEAELQGRADNEGLPAARTPAGPRLTPPRVDLPGTAPPSVELPDVVLPPEIELPPGLDDPGSSGPPRFRESSHSAPVADEAEWDGGGTVYEITLNRLLTGGYNMDGEPGDNGLLAVIEPRDLHLFARLTTADGRVLTTDRPIRVELLDNATAAGLQRSFDQGLRRLQSSVAADAPEVEPAAAEHDPGGLRSVLVRPDSADDEETALDGEPQRIESARRPEWTPTRH